MIWVQRCLHRNRVVSLVVSVQLSLSQFLVFIAAIVNSGGFREEEVS